MLVLKNVSFSYNLEQPLLKEINFTFAKGEFVALGGRNGSGKTTLTRILMGLEKPSHGQIFLDGQDISKTGADLRSRHIGYVFQQPERQMFRPTVREEIAFGPKQQGLSSNELKERVEKSLQAMQLAEIAHLYPHTLSKGQKQRVAIASSLSMKSEYLILDEPTSGQDSEEKEVLLKLLAKLHDKGLSILFVTHDMDIVANNCDKAIILDQGRIAFNGTPKVLFTEIDDLAKWSLTRPDAISLGLHLPNAPYCPKMQDFYLALMNTRSKVS